MNDTQIIQSLIDACDPDQLRRLVAEYGYPDEEITPELLNDIYLEDRNFADDLASITDPEQVVPVLNSSSGINHYWEPSFATDYKTPSSSGSSSMTSGSSSKWTASDINTTLKTSTDFAATVLGFLFPSKYKYDAQAAMAMTEAERIRYERELSNSQKSAIPWVWIIVGVFVLILAVLYFNNRK